MLNKHNTICYGQYQGFSIFGTVPSVRRLPLVCELAATSFLVNIIILRYCQCRSDYVEDPTPDSCPFTYAHMLYVSYIMACLKQANLDSFIGKHPSISADTQHEPEKKYRPFTCNHDPSYIIYQSLWSA